MNIYPLYLNCSTAQNIIPSIKFQYKTDQTETNNLIGVLSVFNLSHNDHVFIQCLKDTCCQLSSLLLPALSYLSLIDPLLTVCFDSD